MNVLGTYHGATLLNTNTKNMIKLEYYTIEKQMNIKKKQLTYYGISIVKKEYCRNGIKCEKQSVEKISKNRRKVKDIVKVLKDYKVTPIALKDIIEDLMKKDRCKIA